MKKRHNTYRAKEQVIEAIESKNEVFKPPW